MKFTQVVVRGKPSTHTYHKSSTQTECSQKYNDIKCMKKCHKKKKFGICFL